VLGGSVLPFRGIPKASTGLGVVAALFDPTRCQRVSYHRFGQIVSLDSAQLDPKFLGDSGSTPATQRFPSEHGNARCLTSVAGQFSHRVLPLSSPRNGDDEDQWRVAG
jgi:hypothetical protein